MSGRISSKRGVARGELIVWLGERRQNRHSDPVEIYLNDGSFGSQVSCGVEGMQDSSTALWGVLRCEHHNGMLGIGHIPTSFLGALPGFVPISQRWAMALVTFMLR